jgi:recombination protein RecT
MPKPDFVIPFDSLPERFAESVAHPPAVPATPRPAATVVLLRDGVNDVEVLLLRRARTSGFVPGAYVFPGGRVDGTDAATAVVDRLDGLSAQEAERRLELPGAEPPALAYYLAAVREAFEETGILIGCGADRGAPATAAEDEAVNALRNDLMVDRLSFDGVLDRMGCRIDGGSIQYFAHWITPEPEPRRYDTRFFAARVRYGAHAVVDPREMTDAVWLTPAKALRRHEARSLPMVFPTIKTLQRLSSYHRADEALAALGRGRVPTIMPRLVLTPAGVGMETDS